MFSESFILEIFIEFQGAAYYGLSRSVRGFCHFPDLLLLNDIRLTIWLSNCCMIFVCPSQLTVVPFQQIAPLNVINGTQKRAFFEIFVMIGL